MKLGGWLDWRPDASPCHFWSQLVAITSNITLHNVVLSLLLIYCFNYNLSETDRLSVNEIEQETWIMPDPFVSGYMTMSKLGSLSSLKTRKNLHLMMKTIKFCFCYILFKES